MTHPVLTSSSVFLFDFDGTLVDSLPLHERAFLDVLHRCRPDLAVGFDYGRFKGRDTPGVFRELGCSSQEAGELAAVKRQTYEAAVKRGELMFMPGAARCLKTLAERGIRSVVATSGSRPSVGAAMEALGIADHFEGVVTAGDVPRGKPAPDIFLQALSRFDIPAADAIVIEDSAAGVQAARAAGLPVIGVYDEEIAPDVDLFLPTLGLLASRLAARSPTRL